MAAGLTNFFRIYATNLSADEQVISQVVKCTHDKSGLSADYLAKGRNYRELLHYYKQRAGAEEAGRELFLRSSACVDGAAASASRAGNDLAK